MVPVLIYLAYKTHLRMNYGTMDIDHRAIARAYNNGENNWEEALRMAVISSTSPAPVQSTWRNVGASIIDKSWMVTIALSAVTSMIQQLIGMFGFNIYPWVLVVMNGFVSFALFGKMLKEFHGFLTKKNPHFTYRPLSWNEFVSIQENATSLNNSLDIDIAVQRESLSTPVYNFQTRPTSMADVVEISDNINHNLRMGFATLSTELKDVKSRLGNVESRLGNVEKDVKYNRSMLDKIAKHLGMDVEE
jgi:hypothetical protein